MILRPGMGFVASQGAADLIQLTISGTVYDYNVFTAASGMGDPSANVVDGLVEITMLNGAVVGSTSTATAAMRSGSGWGSGWAITVKIASGAARIQGKGGKGGVGRTTTTPNQAPGGGGGAGTQAGEGGGLGGSSGTSSAGGAGGPVAQVFGSTLIAAQAAQAGGNALEATSGGPDVTLSPESGATLEVWGGGGGGGYAEFNLTQEGAPGGGPGEDGVSSLQPGGSNGLAYYEPGAASIIEAGAGVIDARGV